MSLCKPPLSPGWRWDSPGQCRGTVLLHQRRDRDAEAAADVVRQVDRDAAQFPGRLVLRGEPGPVVMPYLTVA